MRSTNRSNWVRTGKHSPPTAEGRPSSALPSAYCHCYSGPVVLLTLLRKILEDDGRKAFAARGAAVGKEGMGFR